MRLLHQEDGEPVAEKEEMNLTNDSFYDMRRDGITQGLISLWLSCRQKAKLYLQGWDSKYHKETLIDGNIGHGVLELAYTEIKEKRLKATPSSRQTRNYVDLVEKKWYAENPKPAADARVMVEKACAVMEVLLPLYFDYWHDDFKKKEWVSLEQKFSMPLHIVKKNGVVERVPMRGKKDGTFRSSKGIWLFETKLKAQISEESIAETLGFETQTMLYLLQTWGGADKPLPRGCLYNIVRRASLRQKVKENIPAFAKRVKKDIEDRPDFYFVRLESPTTLRDLKSFKAELTDLVQDMWNWWHGDGYHYKNTYSCIGKYGKCLFLPVCARADYSSLAKRKVVFKELEDF